MRAAQIFEPSTPIKIREPRNLHMGRVLAVALIAVAGFGAYRLVSTHGRSTDGRPDGHRAARGDGHGQGDARAGHAHRRLPPKDEAVIKLTAISDCWVGLNSPTGQSIYQGIVPAGTTGPGTRRTRCRW